jgi:L-aminopeptidase/D-esterase-like protein
MQRVTAAATTRILFTAVALAACWPVHGQPAAQPADRGLTAVPGIRVGAPGTRETDLLSPSNLVERVNAIVLAGGSAFGLDAAQGVVRYLEEQNIGYKTAAGVVPIVPAAILFDLGFGGDAKVRPTADCGYRAALAATTGPVAEGNVGAGAGATVGKMGGIAGPGATGGQRLPMKAGVGTASIHLPSGLVVAAIAAVNAAGDIIDPATGLVVAGTRNPDGTLADIRRLLRGGEPATPTRAAENTTIAVVATNARLTKEQVNRMALMADDGLARAIYPSHTIGDGDTVFALATGLWTGDTNPTIVGALAAEALSEAIVRAAVQATASGGLAAARDLDTIPARFR